MNAHRLRLCEVIIFGALAGWLIAAALYVKIDTYDGLDTLCNARYFLGWSDQYMGNRSPLMGLLLTGAEWIRDALNLHALDARPHHMLMAVLHVGYLVGAYLLMTRFFGRGAATLAAFVAAIPTFIFFSYAPFISHDILPGLLLLGMILLAEKFCARPTRNTWLALVVLGAAAALIKYTYALFWIILLPVSAIFLRNAELNRQDANSAKYEAKEGSSSEQSSNMSSRLGGSSTWRPWRLGGYFSRAGALGSNDAGLALAAGAAVSGAITWLVVAWSLSTLVPNVPFLMRPATQINHLFFDAPGELTDFPIWVYLRNFPAFGWITTLLIIPGLVMALRPADESRTPRLRAIAVTWLTLFIIMHLLHLREVRYLAMLAPLSACLIIAPLRALMKNAQRSGAVIALLAVTLVAPLPYAPLYEAAHFFQPFYRDGQAPFFAPLEQHDPPPQYIIIDWHMLTFTPLKSQIRQDEPQASNLKPLTASPLAGDRYHRLFHFGGHHLRVLFDLSPDVLIQATPKELAGLKRWPPRTALITATPTLINPPTLARPAAPQGIESHHQAIVFPPAPPAPAPETGN